MGEAVYLLCALTSLLCAVLLIRSYRATRTPLLFWSSLCFIGFAANNALLFVDLVLVQSIDLSLARNLVAVASVTVLLYGLIWRTD